MRLTSGTPFTGNLTGGNVISLYFDVGSLDVGDVYTGTFQITGSTLQFIAVPEPATLALLGFRLRKRFGITALSRALSWVRANPPEIYRDRPPFTECFIWAHA